MNGSRIPHSLRIIILLLRIALGLNFFYLGVNTLWGPSGGTGIGNGSLVGLYAWIGGSFGGSLGSTALATFWAWISLVIGACLIAGLITRLVSITGIVLTLASYYAPTPSGSIPLNPLQFANDGTLIVLCFLVLLFSGAGEYIGLDQFLHVHLAGKHRK